MVNKVEYIVSPYVSASYIMMMMMMSAL